MSRFSLVFIVFTLTVVSCKKDDADHLPPQKMEQVLMDISIAETYSTMLHDNSHPPGSKNTDSLTSYYKDIFAHHHITREQFKTSLAWYRAHPDDLDTVYTNLSAKADKSLEDENKKAKKLN